MGVSSTPPSSPSSPLPGLTSSPSNPFPMLTRPSTTPRPRCPPCMPQRECSPPANRCVPGSARPPANARGRYPSPPISPPVARAEQLPGVLSASPPRGGRAVLRAWGKASRAGDQPRAEGSDSENSARRDTALIFRSIALQAPAASQPVKVVPPVYKGCARLQPWVYFRVCQGGASQERSSREAVARALTRLVRNRAGWVSLSRTTREEGSKASLSEALSAGKLRSSEEHQIMKIEDVACKAVSGGASVIRFENEPLLLENGQATFWICYLGLWVRDRVRGALFLS